MNKPPFAKLPAAAVALLLSVAASTASAVQIRYELQGVFDQSPTPVALIGGFTFDTDTVSFSDITVHFADPVVMGVTTGTFDQNPTLYTYATDQFVAGDGLGNFAVLNHGGFFSAPGTFAMTQTGLNSISYVFLAGAGNPYDVVNGNIAAVPEPGTWAALTAGLVLIGLRARRRG